MSNGPRKYCYQVPRQACRGSGLTLPRKTELRITPADKAMTTPTLESIQAYYDERVDGKIRDFTHPNPRIEAALQLVAEWAPPKPKRILEIGCGIGATSWRMARAWPNAEVIGADVSPISIEVAKTCFQLPNLTYRTGLIKEGVLAGGFDLVLLMDTYEHIALDDRAMLHAAIKSLLSADARLVMTVPTPAVLNYARTAHPSDLQPVDEDVTPADIIVLAKETDTQLLYYREIGIWQYGDYVHLVLGRYQTLTTVELREYRPEGVAALKQRVQHLLGHGQTLSTGRCDYLGSDVLRPSPRDAADRFRVTARERKRLASSWFRRSRVKTPRSASAQIEAQKL
jgi:2-polyprenyl-3-methyl-5-hydroxy-6-metoxy-1,4-benzoquinol methylase